MKLDSWGRLGHADGGSEFELATNIVVMSPEKENNSRPSYVDAHRHIVHESSHWNRFHGCSVGVALSLMKYASERVIVDHLPALEPSEKLTLFGEMRSGKKIFDFANPRRDGSDRFTLTRQLWLDLFGAYWAFYNMSALDGTRWDFSEAIGSALTDVLLWGEPLFSAETAQSGRTAPQVRLIDESSFGKAALNGKELTTRHILECASTIDELFSLGLDDPGVSSTSGVAKVARSMGYPFADEQLEEYAYSMLTRSEYGLPWQAYTGITGDTRYPQSQIMTLLLCDLALNPPLPPFLDLDESAEVRWLDTYPPIRFLRSCQAVGELGALPGRPGDDLLLEYSADLYRAAQLANPYEMGGLFAGETLANIEDTRFSFPGREIGTLEGDYITFLSWAQRKLWDLRRRSPTLLAFFGANGRSQSHEGAEYVLAGGTGAGWFTEPFQSYEGTYRSALDGDVSLQYLASLALYLTLRDVVVAPGTDTRDRLPINLRDYRFWQDSKTQAEALFGCPIWATD